MTAFNDPLDFSKHTVLPISAELPASARLSARLKSGRLLALPALAALVLAVSAAISHPAPLHQVRQALQEFRGEAPGGSDTNPAMNSALIMRGQLLMHRLPKISAGQEAMLTGILSGPADDMTQSEALDVLGIAKRMHALSPAQEKEDAVSALKILRRSPGPMVRLESARLLGHLGNAAALPALLALQEDHDPKVQEAAEEALAQMRK